MIGSTKSDNELYLQSKEDTWTEQQLRQNASWHNSKEKKITIEEVTEI